MVFLTFSLIEFVIVLLRPRSCPVSFLPLELSFHDSLQTIKIPYIMLSTVMKDAIFLFITKISQRLRAHLFVNCCRGSWLKSGSSLLNIRWFDFVFVLGASYHLFYMSMDTILCYLSSKCFLHWPFFTDHLTIFLLHHLFIYFNFTPWHGKL